MVWLYWLGGALVIIGVLLGASLTGQSWVAQLLANLIAKLPEMLDDARQRR